jgi:hypothetical protein
MFVSHVNTQKLVELFYPILQVILRVASADLQREGIDLDISLLPSTGALSRHMGTSRYAVYSTADGFETVWHSTLPGAGAGAAAPLAIGLLVPAVGSARRASERAQAMNYLKMIGLSMHNYHDTYRAFPAAYSVDEEGEPLLSWRVHVLPFLEQTPLYEQFRLDEPWDSEHNRQLIERMPEIYRAPGSSAEPGKTVYLGLRHPDSVIVPPADESDANRSPRGTTIAEISDGTSNTLLVVEANDESAVIWTKPDDFDPNLDNPVRDLLGLRPGGFLVLICDGSVRFMPQTLGPKLFKELMTKDGGEPVNFP